MGAVIRALAAALAKLDKATLARLADKLGAVTGKSVPARSSAIISKFRTLFKDHPIKAAIALNGVIAFLPGFDISLLDDLLGGSPQGQEVLENLYASRKEAREESLGDGDPDTVFGMDGNDVVSATVAIADTLEIYERGVRAAGGRRAFDDLRAAILLEDREIEISKTLSNQF